MSKLCTFRKNKIVLLTVIVGGCLATEVLGFLVVLKHEPVCGAHAWKDTNQGSIAI